MDNLTEKFEKIKQEVFILFPPDSNKKEIAYTRRNWIFPNHFNLMIELVEDMCKRYKGDEMVCKISAILHDTGLVYGRTSADPKGHEERSIEYARMILKKYGVPKSMHHEIIDCIKATEAYAEPKKLNEKIVRTADALSQFISVHFFAKAAFSGDWNSYSVWLEKKAKNNFNKICFDKERERAKPVRDYILSAIELYKAHNPN